MIMKKIFGYIFIVIAIILTIPIVGLFPNLLETIIEFFKIFTGSLDSYEVGKVMGLLVYWIVHFVLTITLWIYSNRWIKTRK